MPFVILRPIYVHSVNAITYFISDMSDFIIHNWPRRSLQDQEGQKKYNNELHRCLKISRRILERCINEIIDLQLRVLISF